MFFSFLFRSSHSRMFYKIGALKDFANFTGKHLCWSVFLITLQTWGLQLFKKRLYHMWFPSNFAKIFQNIFTEHLWTTAWYIIKTDNFCLPFTAAMFIVDNRDGIRRYKFAPVFWLVAVFLKLEQSSKTTETNRVFSRSFFALLRIGSTLPNIDWVRKKFYSDETIENVVLNINVNKVTHCISNFVHSPKHCVKSFFWSVFSCIQSKNRKIRTIKNCVFLHFSCSEITLPNRFKSQKNFSSCIQERSTVTILLFL